MCDFFFGVLSLYFGKQFKLILPKMSVSAWFSIPALLFPAWVWGCMMNQTGNWKELKLNKEIKIEALPSVISCLVSPKREWGQCISGWMWMRRDDGTAPFSGWFRTRLHGVSGLGMPAFPLECSLTLWPRSQLTQGDVLQRMCCSSPWQLGGDGSPLLLKSWALVLLWSPLYLLVAWLIILLIPNWYFL